MIPSLPLGRAIVPVNDNVVGSNIGIGPLSCRDIIVNQSDPLGSGGDSDAEPARCQMITLGQVPRTVDPDHPAISTTRPCRSRSRGCACPGSPPLRSRGRWRTGESGRHRRRPRRGDHLVADVAERFDLADRLDQAYRVGRLVVGEFDPLALVERLEPHAVADPDRLDVDPALRASAT